MSFLKAFEAILKTDASAANEFRKALRAIKNSGQSMSGDISTKQKEIRSLQSERKIRSTQNEDMQRQISDNAARISEIDVRIAELAGELQQGDKDLRDALGKLQQFADEIGE